MNYEKILNLFMGNILKDPTKFFYLLTTAGYNGIEARKLIWDLQYAKMRSADPKVRAKLLSFLRNLIDTITADPILYSRMRSLAVGKKLGGLALNVKEDMSYGASAGEANGVAMGGSSLQGVLGTNLGVPYSGPSTDGIDSYDTILGSIIRRQKIKTKRKKKNKKRHKIKFPM